MNTETTREITLTDKRINDESDAYVIAEIGNNHQGDLQLCKEMFRVAKESGVDAVKLQKRDNKNLYTQEMFNSPYDNRNSFGETYGLHREYLEFGIDEYFELKTYAEKLDVAFFATAFDINSANVLAELELPITKIASGDLTNIPLLKFAADLQKPIILSTGGGTFDDVKRAYDEIMPRNDKLVILQCTAAYPARTEDLNLRVIQTFRAEFPDIVIGYSGHDNGIAMPVVAYMLGARVIEKHFTLDRTLRGTDQAFSLAPHALKHMVRDLKRSRVALGESKKRPLEVESTPINKMRKKIVAARNLDVGDEIRETDLDYRSPGDGISPYRAGSLIGKTIVKAISIGGDITLDSISEM